MAPKELRYRARLRERCAALVGRVCHACGTSDTLEYAHLAPTPLSGIATGRGLKRRLLDIQRFPERYVRLCRACHAALDGRGGMDASPARARYRR